MTENEFIDWYYGKAEHETEVIDGGSYEFTVDGYKFVTRPARNGNYCTLYDVSGDRRACIASRIGNSFPTLWTAVYDYLRKMLVKE